MLKIDTNALKILLIASTLLFQSCSKKENKYVSTRRTPTDNALALNSLQGRADIALNDSIKVKRAKEDYDAYQNYQSVDAPVSLKDLKKVKRRPVLNIKELNDIMDDSSKNNHRKKTQHSHVSHEESATKPCTEAHCDLKKVIKYNKQQANKNTPTSKNIDPDSKKNKTKVVTEAVSAIPVVIADPSIENNVPQNTKAKKDDSAKVLKQKLSNTYKDKKATDFTKSRLEENTSTAPVATTIIPVLVNEPVVTLPKPTNKLTSATPDAAIPTSVAKPVAAAAVTYSKANAAVMPEIAPVAKPTIVTPEATPLAPAKPIAAVNTNSKASAVVMPEIVPVTKPIAAPPALDKPIAPANTNSKASAVVMPEIAPIAKPIAAPPALDNTNSNASAVVMPEITVPVVKPLAETIKAKAAAIPVSPALATPAAKTIASPASVPTPSSSTEANSAGSPIATAKLSETPSKNKLGTLNTILIKCYFDIKNKIHSLFIGSEE